MNRLEISFTKDGKKYARAYDFDNKQELEEGLKELSKLALLTYDKENENSI